MTDHSKNQPRLRYKIEFIYEYSGVFVKFQQMKLRKNAKIQKKKIADVNSLKTLYFAGKIFYQDLL